MTHSPEPWIEGEWRINEEARGGKNPCKRSWIFTTGSGIHSGVQCGDIIEDVSPPPTEIIRQLDYEEGGGYEISDDDMERIMACVNACYGWTTTELQNHVFLKTGTTSESGRPVAHLAAVVKVTE